MPRSKPRGSIATVIGKRLAATSDPKTKLWWDRYLKGAIPFRGVPMAGIRQIVHEVWAERELDRLPLQERIEVALRQFEQRHAEDKLAGVLMLGELLLNDLTTEHVTDLARPFEKHICDWGTCDWYCVKVLGRFVETDDRRTRAQLIAEWRHAEPFWQRRAAAVAFVNLAPRGDAFFRGFTSLLLTVCAANVKDAARFSQTGVGWLLRELSRAEPERVRAFVDEHEAEMSKEALKAATARLP
ncbi:MAG TPA: DNA alkylation repair protein [Actinomycetota bacterium]|nr:DNA alkylation repair protein [Actinomycetota bacterium]